MFLYQVTAGTFRPASFLSALNMVATVAIAYAGWINHRTGDTPAPEPDTMTRDRGAADSGSVRGACSSRWCAR